MRRCSWEGARGGSNARPGERCGLAGGLGGGVGPAPGGVHPGGAVLLVAGLAQHAAPFSKL